MKGKFQKQLEQMAVHKIILLLFVGAGMFLLGLLVVTCYENEHNASRNLENLEASFRKQYEYSSRLLNDENVLQDCIALLEGNSTEEELTRTVDKAAEEGMLRYHLILIGQDDRLFYTTFSEEDLTGYLLNYNGAICYHARETEDGIYNAVYYNPGNYSDYIFVKPIENGDKGYLSLYLSGTNWNYVLSENNYDGVITDSMDNIIYCSKASFMEGFGKFDAAEQKIVYQGEQRYWVKEKKLQDYGVTIYSMVYYPGSPVWVVGLLLVLIMGVVWYCIAKSMSNSMAENNARMINYLVKEMRIIQNGNLQHRIDMHTDSEFDEAASQVNQMLDTVQRLNEQNLELVKLRNASEINQLIAQINPHFLYNTLELIRNLALTEPKQTSDVILKLTRILRYSIDNSCNTVCLEEDMEYLGYYRDIQKYRFGDRLLCEINVEEACLCQRVPKLLVQPVVENSIKYGFQKKMKIHIGVRGWMDNNILRLEIIDNGPGIPKEKVERLNQLATKEYQEKEALGLHNIARRLYLQYGAESGLQVTSREGEGTTVRISISE